MNPFQLSRNTTLLSDAVTEKAVELACERLRRDMEKTLTDIVKNRNRIILCKKQGGCGMIYLSVPDGAVFFMPKRSETGTI